VIETSMYRALGKSGLRVSPLALGTMTFGRSDWGCDAGTACTILDAYVERGGNLLDTADVYSFGASEELIGSYLKARGMRDRIVLSTKFSLGSARGEGRSGGNGRRSMMRSLEASLRRLGTDFIDLYLIHTWDGDTPVEEVMRGLDDLVSAGKIRYVGMSNVPAWYAARAQTLAEWRGYEPLCSLQLEYSLAERALEFEYTDLCQNLGMSIVAWSPLANGLFSGKYLRGKAQAPDDGRLAVESPTWSGERGKRTAKNWEIVEELRAVAAEVARPMPQVALNWLAGRSAVGSVILGASKPSQIADNLDALSFTLSSQHVARLDGVSRPPMAQPYDYWPWVAARMRADAWGETAGPVGRET
jgi:aryl-alcohol dehydrogenase-like predicted oxidoreductase